MTAPGQSHGPLTPDHLQQLTAAKARGKAIRRACTFSRFNAWTLAFFAAISTLILFINLLIGGLTFTAVFITLALAATTVVEFIYGTRLKRFHTGAARAIGWNQAALGIAIALYCAMRIWSLTHGEQLLSDPTVAEAVGADMIDMLSHVAVATYAGIAALVLIYQALVAVYYVRLEPKVAAYKRDTPAWVIDAQQRGVVA